MNLQELGKRIKHKRQWLDLTQQELSQKAQVKLSTIARLESGKAKDIYFRQILRILAVLDIRRLQLYSAGMVILDDIKNENQIPWFDDDEN